MVNTSSEYDWLTLDPYCKPKMHPNAVSVDEFYSQMYLEPGNTVIQTVEKFLADNAMFTKMVQIIGYAGCGKTVFCHWLMKKFDTGEDFYYSFQRGEGKEFSLAYIEREMRETITAKLIDIEKGKRDLCTKLNRIAPRINKEEEWFQLLYTAFYQNGMTQFIGLIDNTLHDNPNEPSARLTQFCSEKFEEILYSDGSIQFSLGNKVRFLLFLDFLIRCLNETDCKKELVICLLDNLDNLSFDALSELYQAVRDVIEEIDAERMVSNMDRFQEAGAMKYIVLFPLRDATDKKLCVTNRYYKYQENVIFSPHGITGRNTNIIINLSETCPNPEDIVKKRVTYYQQTNRITTKLANSFAVFTGLLDSGNGLYNKFFPNLFNNNYDVYISVFFSLLANERYIKQAYQLLRETKYNNKLPLVAVGIRELILRDVYSYFDDRGVFDFPNEINQGILGLSNLNAKNDVRLEYRVTFSRLFLTQLINGNTDLSKIIENYKGFFDGEFIEYICYAMANDAREWWRRLIEFSDIVPKQREDIGDILRSLKQIKSEDGIKCNTCLSGITYLRYVVPSFEFYSYRTIKADATLSRNDLPPLFSPEAMCNEKWKFVLSTVYNSVYKHSEDLFDYDMQRVEACLKVRNIDLLINETFVNINGELQFHFLRMIFSHIGYIECFRKYYLLKDEVLEDVDVKESYHLSDKKKIDDNRELISILVCYLALFDPDLFREGGRYKKVLDMVNMSPAFYNQLDVCKNYSTIIAKLKRDFPTKIERLEVGYKMQRKAVFQLMEKIIEICESDFTIIGNVAIRGDR